LVAVCGVTQSAAMADPRAWSGQLADAETLIAVDAGEHAPRLRSLRLGGSRLWNNRDEETLPGEVFIHGSSQPVAWRLDRSASRFEPKEIELTYIADSPHLLAQVAVARARCARPARAQHLHSEFERRGGEPATAAQLAL
jgi:hypothetical protein